MRFPVLTWMAGPTWFWMALETTMPHSKLTAKGKALRISAAGPEFDDGFAPATQRAYRSDWAAFTAWCHHGQHPTLPSTPDHVAAYIQHMAVSCKPATIARHVSTIAGVHRQHGYSDPTKVRTVQVAMRRLYRQKGCRQRQAYGITQGLRDQMLAVLGQSPLDIRNRAMLMMAYDLGCRRSELVALQAQDIERAEDGSAIVLIRRSKTDQDGQGHLRYAAPDTVGALDAWMDVSGVEEGVLFRAVRKGTWVGSVVLGAPLDGGDVARLWKLIAQRAQIDPAIVCNISGHSTRVGMAQDMAGAGIDLASIMQTGNWKSPAMVGRYIERMQVRQGAAARLAAKQGRLGQVKTD